MNEVREGRKGAYKKQGGVQVSDIFRDHVVVVFIGNFLVGGPKVCGWVGFNPRGLPVCDCLSQPQVGKLIRTERRKLDGRLTE